MPSIWFETSNCKIPHLKFVKFFRTVPQSMGKGDIWAILYFYPSHPLNNVEKQWAKLTSSYVMGAQHCIGREGGF